MLCYARRTGAQPLHPSLMLRGWSFLADFIDKNTTIEDIQQTEDENVSFIDNTKLEVHKGDEFLFIGDSLMQGVAIALNRDLIDLGLKANDLSKQNTGLSYKSYFDWAKATKEAFAKNPNIKYLVVLLGANDPWDIKKGGVYHRFGSDSWIDIYTYRVNEIINIAKVMNVPEKINLKTLSLFIRLTFSIQFSLIRHFINHSNYILNKNN